MINKLLHLLFIRFLVLVIHFYHIFLVFNLHEMNAEFSVIYKSLPNTDSGTNKNNKEVRTVSREESDR